MISMNQQLDAVVGAGLFTDREQVVNRALQALFAVRPNLRAEAAIELFRRDDVSFLRAAELAGLDFESFRILLQSRGIQWAIEAESAEAMDESSEAFFQENG
jgi:predicted HTH domain antitoxin